MNFLLAISVQVFASSALIAPSVLVLTKRSVSSLLLIVVDSCSATSFSTRLAKEIVAPSPLTGCTAVVDSSSVLNATSPLSILTFVRSLYFSISPVIFASFVSVVGPFITFDAYLAPATASPRNATSSKTYPPFSIASRKSDTVDQSSLATIVASMSVYLSLNCLGVIDVSFKSFQIASFWSFLSSVEDAYTRPLVPCCQAAASSALYTTCGRTARVTQEPNFFHAGIPVIPSLVSFNNLDQIVYFSANNAGSATISSESFCVLE